MVEGMSWTVTEPISAIYMLLILSARFSPATRTGQLLERSRTSSWLAVCTDTVLSASISYARHKGADKMASRKCVFGKLGEECVWHGVGTRSHS